VAGVQLREGKHSALERRRLRFERVAVVARTSRCAGQLSEHQSRPPGVCEWRLCPKSIDLERLFLAQVARTIQSCKMGENEHKERLASPRQHRCQTSKPRGTAALRIWNSFRIPAGKIKPRRTEIKARHRLLFDPQLVRAALPHTPRSTQRSIYNSYPLPSSISLFISFYAIRDRWGPISIFISGGLKKRRWPSQPQTRSPLTNSSKWDPPRVTPHPRNRSLRAVLRDCGLSGL
jgi:hypothetical protein